MSEAQEGATRTAAELLREVAARDPEAHRAALGRGYGVGPDVPQPTPTFGERYDNPRRCDGCGRLATRRVPSPGGLFWFCDREKCFTLLTDQYPGPGPVTATEEAGE